MELAIRCHGPNNWHIIYKSVAERFGIVDDKRTGRTAAVRLSWELCGRYVLSVSWFVFITFQSQNVFVELNTHTNLTYVHKNRRNILDEVKVSVIQDKYVSRRRIYYLTFDTPEVDANRPVSVRSESIPRIRNQKKKEYLKFCQNTKLSLTLKLYYFHGKWYFEGLICTRYTVCTYTFTIENI